jgi:hypothetical protein
VICPTRGCDDEQCLSQGENCRYAGGGLRPSSTRSHAAIHRNSTTSSRGLPRGFTPHPNPPERAFDGRTTAPMMGLRHPTSLRLDILPRRVRKPSNDVRAVSHGCRNAVALEVASRPWWIATKYPMDRLRGTIMTSDQAESLFWGAAAPMQLSCRGVSNQNREPGVPEAKMRAVNLARG